MADDRARIAALERRVAELEAAMARARGWAPVAPAAQRPPPAPLQPLPPAAQAPAAPPGAGARAWRWESVLGANWLARAGVLLLALGVVFFLRLAYDRGWVPIPGRYAIGLVGGAAMWAAGDWLRGRRLDPAFAQAVAGGGAAILYVTLYLGYALEEYRAALGMTLGLELALLAAAAIALGAYAVWRDLPLLGGVAAALATLLLAPAGDLSTAGVVYAVLLDSALLLAAVARRWDTVALAAILAANVPILAGFAVSDPQVPWQVLLACSLAANACGIAAAQAARPSTWTGADGRWLVSLQAALALAFLAAGAAAALHDAGVPRAAGWALLATGAAGVLASVPLHRPAPGLALAGAALLVVWPIAHFQDSLWTPLALGALALAATLAGLALPRARAWAPWVAIGAGSAGLFLYQGLAHEDGLAAGQPLLAGLAGGALVAAGLLAWRATRGEPDGARYLGLGLGLLALLSTLAALLDSWAVPVSWAAVAVAAVVLGLAPQRAELRLAAFGLFGIVVVRILAVDLAGLGVVARVVAFLATGALLLVAAYLYARGRREAVAAGPPVPPVPPVAPVPRAGPGRGPRPGPGPKGPA